MSIIPGIEIAAPGADGHEQRVVAVAEALPGLLLERGHVRVDLLFEPVRHPAAAAHVRAARLGRDREAGRHGDAQLGHLRQPDPLAAQKLPTALAGLVEVVGVPRQGRDLVTYAQTALPLQPP